MEVNMQEEKIWFLKQMKLFEGMNAEKQIHELDQITQHKHYKKNEPVLLPGDQQRRIYLLKKGHVKLCRISPHGKSVTVAILDPGEIFGEINALANRPSTIVAEALSTLESVTVCEIQYDDFEDYLHRFPEIAVKVLKLVGAQTAQLESRLEDLAFRSVPSRLASLLIDLSEKYGERSAAGIQISLRLTHQNLADLVGATRETVSLIIGEFGRMGIISRKTGHISILEKRQLMQLIKKC